MANSLIKKIVTAAFCTAVLWGSYLASAMYTPSLLNEPVFFGSRLVVTTGAANDSEYIGDLTRRAEKGDAKAIVELAGYFENGEGSIKKDWVQAERLYERAARAGNGEAASALAGHYWLDKSQSDQALKWSRRAIELGEGSAASLAGWHYLSGEGVEQNHLEAARWFENGAEKGDALSQYFLGRMSEEGLGKTKDLELAYYFCKLAAAGDYPPAEDAVDRIKARLSPSQIEQIDQKVANRLKIR